MTKGKEIFEKSDKELVELTQVVDLDYNTREIAKAELVRRQSDAIRRFDDASTKWSKRLFWLSLAVGSLVLFQLLIMLGQAGWLPVIHLF